jgi:CRISPR-associated protein Csm3
MTQNTTPSTKTQPKHFQLRNRYVYEGKLEMQTGLHIGGGKATLSYTDSPIVQTPDELPFIPGSSLKGTLRSTIEKLVASLPAELGLHTCGLPVGEHSEESCPTARQEEIKGERRKHSDKIDETMQKAREQLCHTCQLFGSPFAAARITVNDLYLINDEWSGKTQIRDGVAIDRDGETAKSGAKYDFEVVPSTTVFKLRIIIENATEQDLQLISIGLNEFVSGFGSIGGFRSRGLGACILNDLQCRYMDLNDKDSKQRLQRYLLRKKDDDGLDPVPDIQAFFDDHIKTLFQIAEQQKPSE